MSFSGCVGDTSFGPVVWGCRDDFDFTIKFEKIFLSLVPTSMFIAVSLPRLLYLVRRPVVVNGPEFCAVKLLSIAAYSALQLALLGLTSAESTNIRDLFISSAAVSVLASFLMLALSLLEHARSLRPSTLLTSYLCLTILFDVAQARTLWLASTTNQDIMVTRMTTAIVAIKSWIALLESFPKDRWATLDLQWCSPEQTTGIAGLGAYVWLNRLFLTGYRKVIRLDDLYLLDKNLSAENMMGRLTRVLRTSGGERFGLARTLVKTLTVALLAPIGPRAALIGFTFCQPFLINSTLSYLERPTGERDSDVGYGLIGATILIYGGMALSSALYWYFHERSMWMVRGALTSTIYKKTTEVRIDVTYDSAAVTLMSTDVERIRQGMLMMHEVWANTIEVAIASFLLYRAIGTAFAAPIIVVVVCVFLAAGVARLTGKRQMEWMTKIQTRVGVMAQVVANMKNLKISGLAPRIQDIVEGLRIQEIRAGDRFRTVLCWSVVIAYIPFFISPIITFAWTSTTLSVTTMFTSYSYLLLLCTPLTSLFQSVPQVLAAAACLGRIQAFLQKPPRDDYRQSAQKPPCSERYVSMASPRDGKRGHAEPASVLSISNGAFGWNEEAIILSNINITIPSRQFTMVIGAISSGKSTLCKALLGEVPMFDGRITLGSQNVSRRVGYCDQSSFLSNTTIKQNIIGFSPFVEDRYNEVVEAALLHVDFLTLPRGDDTKVGSNGITLSGGQKQRVSLARALYLETDFFIFDDILSGLDADTEAQVFQKVFGPDGLIKKRGATAVLCTHAVNYSPSADFIIALGEGTVVEQGTFNDLLANQKYVHSLGIMTRDRQTPSASPSVTTPTADPDLAVPLLKADKIVESQAQPSDDHDDTARATGDWSVYKHYYNSIGFWPVFAFFTTSAASGFFCNFQSIWINLWSAGITAQPPRHDNAYYLDLFAVMQLLGLLMLFVAVWICLKWIISISGLTLHRDALRTVFDAPLLFFTTTDNGVVTNLFSQDVSLIDGELPMALVNLALDLAICLGMAAVVATSSPYLAVSYPFLAVVLFVIQKFYLRTSRQLRLLDLEAKSPLYTHFTDTMKGIATFRALGWIPNSISKNHTLLDDSQRPAYLLAMTQRWLAFTLDVVVTVLAVVVVTLSTQLQSTTGFTGASLVTLMTFGPSLTNLIRCYTLLETSIGAVNRLKTFSDTVRPEAGPGEDIVPDELWPETGEIEIKDVSAAYSDTSGESEATETGTPTVSRQDVVLRNLTLTAPAGQRVAICGRSGSGKSSIVLLLLRLLEPSRPGNIYIDQCPLHRIDRNALRQRVIAIPQEIVFLPEGSSFRANLDPLELSAEADCRAALEAVGDLWRFVEQKGGLETAMDPETLSQGQRQLFSIARAILKKRVRSRLRGDTHGEGHGGLLLLDEVSSSVDIHTDRTIQAIIKKEFEGYTVLMVSHRLEMVMDFDKVILMDKGMVVETGPPRVLAMTEGSRFKELVANAQGEQ